MRRVCGAAMLALVAGMSCVSGAPLMGSQSMSWVQANPAQRMTLFYFASDASAAPVLEAVEDAARGLKEITSLPAEAAQWQWVGVDCGASASASDCAAAGFTAGKQWLFTSTNTEGIQAYGGDRTAAAMMQHVQYRFLPADSSDVVPFVDEASLYELLDSATGDEDGLPKAKPVFIKFWEEWCTHCKQLKRFYDQAAGFFQDQVTFMEVECSKTEQWKSFCSKQGVASFPTLILFDGEKPIKYDQSDRSIGGFNKFFAQNLPAERYTPIEDKEGAAGEAVAKPVKAEAKVTKKSNKARRAERKAAAAAAAAAAPPAPAVPATPAAVTEKKKKTAKKSATKRRSKRDEEEEAEEDEDSVQEQADDEDDEEDRRPRKRSSRSRRVRRSRYDDEDEEDDSDLFDEEDEDEDDVPRRRRRRSSGSRKRRSSRYDDDEAEEEDDEDSPAANRRRRREERRKRAATLRKRAPVDAADDADEQQEAPAKKAKKTKKSKRRSRSAKDEL